MRTRAQIFSLDLVISMILVVLAIGTTMQYVEISNYAAKDAELTRNLEWIAVAASDVLVGSANIVCEVQGAGGNTLFYLDNCLQQGKVTSALNANDGKEKLGIPEGYECEIRSEGPTTISAPACDDSPSGASNIFGVERKVVVTNSPLTKAEFDNCISGACGGKLSEVTIKLKVWKAWG